MSTGPKKMIAKVGKWLANAPGSCGMQPSPETSDLPR